MRAETDCSLLGELDWEVGKLDDGSWVRVRVRVRHTNTHKEAVVGMADDSNAESFTNGSVWAAKLLE